MLFSQRIGCDFERIRVRSVISLRPTPSFRNTRLPEPDGARQRQAPIGPFLSCFDSIMKSAAEAIRTWAATSKPRRPLGKLATAAGPYLPSARNRYRSSGLVIQPLAQRRRARPGLPDPEHPRRYFEPAIAVSGQIATSIEQHVHHPRVELVGAVRIQRVRNGGQ
jgi:hypothetical protein